jgi:hypothetical protein
MSCEEYISPSDLKPWHINAIGNHLMGGNESKFNPRAALNIYSRAHYYYQFIGAEKELLDTFMHVIAIARLKGKK